MRILFILISLLFSLSVKGQIEINITIANALPDTITLGKYQGKRVIRIDSIVRDSLNVFKLKKSNLPAGIYTIVYKRDKFSQEEKRTNLLIDEFNQKFEVKITSYLQNTVEYIGSKDNVVLKNYQKSMDSLFAAYRNAKDEWIAREDLASFEEIVKIEQLLQTENKKLIQVAYSPYLKSYISNFDITFPKYTGSLKDQAKQRQDFYENEYLNFLALFNPLYNGIEQGIDFIDLYAVYSSDGNAKDASRRSINILEKASDSNKPLRNYYLNYLFNSYPRMTAHGYDAVTINLVDNFLNEDENYDMPAEKIARMRSTAEKIKSLLPGQPLEPLTLYDDLQKPVNIQEVKAKYTVLIVWSPDCSHCKKELPIVKEKYLKYKAKDIKVATICAKRGASLSDCSSYIKENNMPSDWLFLNDSNSLSGYIQKLDATSYPALYLLDENKNIILKRKGQQTDAELEKIFRDLN
jgi:thiol-disulfide isomerase/thioredoxin